MLISLFPRTVSCNFLFLPKNYTRKILGNGKTNVRATKVFDIGEAASSEVRILFTLADIDEL